MKQLGRNIKIAILFLTFVTVLVIVGLFYQMHRAQTSLLAVAGENRASLSKIYSQAGEIYSSDGVILAGAEKEQRVYAKDLNVQLSVSQVVGDYTHHMSNTIETRYQNELLGKNRNVFEQLILDLSGNGLKGDDVHLTVNANLSSFVYQLLAPYKAAAVVMNYQTGEILSSVSTPATYMENIINYTDIPETALFNRALNGKYVPGSTWKIMNAAAWLNFADYNPELVIESDGSALRANGASDIAYKNMSGLYDLNRAFTTSSNVFFGELAVAMGENYFSDFIRKSGLGKLQNLDKLYVSQAVIDGSKASQDPALLSWFGTGQAVGDLEITMSPLELALITSAVANGGDLLKPHIVQYVENPLRQKKNIAKKTVSQKMFNIGTASSLKELMINAVNSEESIQTTVNVPGFTVGGKSGTVQKETAENRIMQNALWTGFVDSEDVPLALAIVIEDAEYTDATAVKIGSQILAYASKIQFK